MSQMITPRFRHIIYSIAFPALTIAQTIELTLPDAEQRAIETSKLLQASRTRVEQAQLRTKEIATSKLPNLVLQGGYSHLSPVPPFQFTPPFPGAEPVTIAPVILDQTQLRLQLQQILYAGGRILASEEAATLQTQAATDDYRNDQLKLRLNVRTVYWNLYKLRATLQALQQTIRQLEARIRDAQNLQAAGLATPSDVLKLRVQLSTLRAQQLDVEAQQQALTVQLNNLIGLPLSTTLVLTTEPAIEDTINTALDDMIAEALEQRPDITASQARLRSAEAGIAAAQAAWLPTIALNAGYTYANPNPRILPNRQRFDGTWDVGISMSWNLWNWLQPQYQVGQARAQYEAARVTKELLSENAAVEITQNYVALRPARERVSVAREAVIQAEDNYSLVANRFAAGIATSTDVLEAETLLLQARTNEIAARADYMLAKARLLYSLGK
ncbi:MAG: TolC family protein [Bacteroidota bacterium]|nr:TolC family protein [Chlorobiota bacterium]MDW8074578.1 TolC family protein [Bacteroidota bacterium]